MSVASSDEYSCVSPSFNKTTVWEATVL